MDADGTKAELNRLIDICEDLQILFMNIKDRIQELQGGVILLDLTQRTSPSVRSIGRMVPLIGHSLSDDVEITNQVKGELQTLVQRL